MTEEMEADKPSNWSPERVAMASALTRMLVSFRDRPADPLVVVRVYLDELEQFGLEAVKGAVERFKLGRVPGHSDAFAPSVAEMVHEIEREWTASEEMRRTLEKIAARDLPRLEPPPHPADIGSPEEIAARKARVAGIVAAFKADIGTSDGAQREKAAAFWKALAPDLNRLAGHKEGDLSASPALIEVLKQQDELRAIRDRVDIDG